MGLNLNSAGSAPRARPCRGGPAHPVTTLTLPRPLAPPGGRASASWEPPADTRFPTPTPTPPHPPSPLGPQSPAGPEPVLKNAWSRASGHPASAELYLPGHGSSHKRPAATQGSKCHTRQEKGPGSLPCPLRPLAATSEAEPQQATRIALL